MEAINLPQQFTSLATGKIGWDDQLESAVQLLSGISRDDNRLPNGIDVASRLLDLNADRDTVLAALLSDPQLRQTINENPKLIDGYGSTVANLTREVARLNELQDFNRINVTSADQAEKLRRMLLALISDVRVMLIRLCFRAERLKLLKFHDYEHRRSIAQETIDIYAPLANRLGIGLLKWEMEDLSFRALEPQVYKRIAKLLEEKRSEREKFIEDFKQQLTHMISEQDIKADVLGRAKHIVSIWRKMQRKNLEFHQLFDVRAVRVLVDSVADCYAVLGLVHTGWQHIPSEFDDYVANPKPNGYQSLHTAVVAGEGKVVEVQIRTHDMHENSELGVASHWRYKEGSKLDDAMEDSISRMREMLQADSEDLPDPISEVSTELSSERVYVFTPQGKVIDLPKGGTPLDFAYSIHSEVGHRCRGAKINGRIVNLTAVLQTGDEVEILTTKESRPSRDWMNKSLGYIKSASARSKVRNWFNHQDFEQNMLDGKSLYDRTLSRFSIHHANLKEVVEHFKRKSTDHFFADVGRGLITTAQILGFLQTREPQKPATRKSRRESSKSKSSGGISVQGVGDLMTQFARCCKPVPGDPIVGFITLNSGISIHNKSCGNILSLPEEKRQRLIEVEWGEDEGSVYPVDISLIAFPRTGLLQDISTVLANEKVNVLNINSSTHPTDQLVHTSLTVEIHAVEELVTVIDKLAQLQNVQDVKRVG